MAKLDQNTNYFASMTDMMVGILFVFIIMLAYFAFQIQSEETVPKPIFDEVLDQRDAAREEIKGLEFKIIGLEKRISDLVSLVKKKDEDIARLTALIEKLKKRIAFLEDRVKYLEAELAKALKPNPLLEYIASSAAARDFIVESVVADLRKAKIDAKANKQQGVVTISGEGLFESSQSELDSKLGAVEKVRVISDTVLRNVRCVALKGDALTPPLCQGESALLEAVYIEGHTDIVPVPEGVILADGSRNNLELSARRASNTYRKVVEFNPEIIEFKNPDGQQILSVAAYGPQRPIDTRATPDAFAKNRRIDIRFVMYVPANESQLESIFQRLGL